MTGTRVFIILLALTFSLAMNSRAEESNVSSLVDKGIERLVNGQNDDALKLFEQALLVDPKNAEANFRLGQVYLNKRDANKAIEYVKRSTQLDPLNVRYSLNLAGLYESGEKLDLAKAEYQRIIDTGTLDKRVKDAEKKLSMFSGRELANKREYNAALLVYNGLLLDYPNDAEVLYNIGMVYVFLDRVQEAESTFTKLIAIEPKNPIALLNIANIYERTNRPEDAMRSLQTVIDQNFNSPLHKTAKVQYGIIHGRELLKRQDWNGAAQVFQEVVQLDPQRTEAFFNIALANLSLGNIKEAEKGFLAVIKVTPEDFSARLNLGGLYFDSKEYDKSKEQFQYVIDRDKTGKYRQQAQVRLNAMHTMLADQALQAGKVQESLNEYKKALDYYSGNVRASFNRGIIFIQQKQWEQAKVEFESVIRFDPNNLRGRMNLAMIYEQVNELSKAAEQYEIVLQIDKSSEEGKIAQSKWKITKARGLWNDKQLSAAQSLLEDIVKEQPENYEALAYLGIIQQSKGLFQEAAGSFQRVMELRPGNNRIRLMLAQVYEQIGLDNLAASEYRSILFNGAEQDVVMDANNRLAHVESRLSGFFNTLNYNASFDSNMNMNDDNPAREWRTDLALDVIYSFKYRDDFSWRINWSPSYSQMHRTASDFLRSTVNGSIVTGSPEQSWVFSASRQDQQSLVSDQAINASTEMTAMFTRKLFVKALFGLAPVGFEGERIPTGISSATTLRYIESRSGVNLDTIGANVSAYFNQGLRNGVNAMVGYQLGIIRNLGSYVQLNDRTQTIRDPTSGFETTITSGSAILYDSRDYEFNSHTLMASMQRVLGPGVSGSLAPSLVFTNYVNADSSARVVKQEKFRLNGTFVLSGSLYYSFFKDMSYFLNASFVKNLSSMGTGLTKDDINEERKKEELDIVTATFQNTSLGNFTRFTFATGFVMNF